jgi:sulfatase maturation enzyme AslB (radical SAM superfamily)
VINKKVGDKAINQMRITLYTFLATIFFANEFFVKSFKANYKYNLVNFGYKMVSQSKSDFFDKVMDESKVPNFKEFSASRGVNIERAKTDVLQLNIGLYCNQACSHCHVDSSPQRTEMMSFEIAEKCLSILDNSPDITTLDITGGAPELNKCFRFLVEEGRKRKKKVIDRCNLTVLLLKDQEDLVDFLKKNEVNVVASLPCYTEGNVDKQRGNGNPT